MFSLNDGFSLKPQLRSSRVLVFHLGVIVFLLAESCGGQSELVGPPQPVVALAGDAVILPCHLEPAADVVSQTLEWGRLDLEPRFVYLWFEGQNYPLQQNPSYQGRTSLSREKLKLGDVSLSLSTVKHSDNGMYRCHIPSFGKETKAELLVGSVSSAVITGTNINSSTVTLQCESKGWYPEPEVLWLDAEGNLLSGPTETVRGPDDLYIVSSRLTVEKRHNNTFTCRVQQKNINQTRETHIHITADCHLPPSCSFTRFTFISVVFISLICAAAFVLWRWRRDQIKDAEMNQEREGEQLLQETKRKDLLKKWTEDFYQNLQKNKEQVVETLKKLQELLEKLNHELKQQTEEMEREMNDTDDKVQTEKMKKNTEQRYIEMKEITVKSQLKLKDRKQTQKQLQRDTEKLVEKIEEVFKTMRDRKKEIENDKTIENHLKKMKKQREEIQTKLQET